MFWMLPLALAAGGALADKENPLRGAAMGAGIGLTGGAAAGALGAGAAGAGAAGTTAGAGAAGAGAAGSGLLAAEGAGAAGGGLLGGSGLSGSLVGSGALTSSGANAAALGGSQLGGTMVGSGALAPTGAGGALLGGGVAAEQAAAPVVDRGTSAGLLDKVNFQTGGNYDNLMKTGKNANSVYSQYEQNKPQQQVAQPMPMQNKPLDLTPIINDASKMREYDMSENERRKRMMAQYAQFAGGY